MEKGVLDEEREKIRELHQRQQDSLKSLQALENRFCHIAINDEETLRGSSVASRVPTLELMANAPVMELPPLEKVPKLQPNTITIELSTPNDSDTSDSDATMSGDDNEEQISTEELAKAADHVKKLLKRITMLQKSFDVDKKKHRKRHVHKIYQRFCRKFEPGIKPSTKEANFGELRADDSFDLIDLRDSGGSLECFDFDSFLHAPNEITPFLLHGFEYPEGQHSMPQQANNSKDMPATQSSQYPPLTSSESLEPYPPFYEYMPHDPSTSAVGTGPDSSSDPSAQRPERSLDQGRSLLARGSTDLLVQMRAQMQMQSQVTPQPQAQTQHSPLQSPQVTPHDWRVQIPETGQILPSLAMRKLRSTKLRPVSTPGLSAPAYSRRAMPETSRSPQSGVESSLDTQAPILTTDSTLLPQPPIRNTALQDYQNQLMLLDCRQRERNPLLERLEREQDGTSHFTTGRVSTGSRKKAVEDPDASPFIQELPNAEYLGNTLAKMPRRKRAMTAEERDEYRSTRALKACPNCKRSKLRVKQIRSIFRPYANQL